MADTTATWTRFFQKVQEDERILTERFPQIAALGQGASVPAAVLQNYEIARQDVQARMAFTRDLLRQYSDPKTGDTTPEPNWLPGLGVSATGLTTGMSFQDASEQLRALPPMQLVSGSQIVISAPPPASVTQVSAGDQLGNPIVVIAVIGALIVVTGITAKFIIDAADQKQLKLAEQAVELEAQKNFARIWDTAQGLLKQCVGSNPTPDIIAKCWDSVAQRFPDIAKSIPNHKFSSLDSGIGFFGKLGLAAAGVGVVIAGVWAYRKWGRRDGGGDEEAMAPHASRGRAPSAHGTWMNGAEMARPEPPKRGYGAPPPRKRSAPKRLAAGRK